MDIEQKSGIELALNLMVKLQMLQACCNEIVRCSVYLLDLLHLSSSLGHLNLMEQVFGFISK